MLVSPVTHALDAARTDLLHERQHRAHEQGQAKAQGRELVGVQAELAQIEASLYAVWAAR